MENELIESRLRRDNTAATFLIKDANKARYADIEDDVAPLRTTLGTNLTKANGLIDQVITADNDNITPRKKGFRNQLTTLVLRRIKALRAHAKGLKPAPDTDLLSRLPRRPADIKRLTESSFPDEAKRLLALGSDIAPAALTKRRYTPAHHSQATGLLQKLTATNQEGTDNDDTGATSRQALERLIKANARLIAELEEFFAPYKDPDDEEALQLYTEWRQAIKVDQRGGLDGPRDNGEKSPASDRP